MIELPPTVKAMLTESEAPTAPIKDFLEAYDRTPNLWWMLSSGHHENLFDMLRESTDQMLYRAWTIIENASNWYGTTEHDERWIEAAERWRDEWHATFTTPPV